MSIYEFSNNLSTTLIADVAPADTSIQVTLADADAFIVPAGKRRTLTLENNNGDIEIMYMTDSFTGGSSTIPVVRAFEGTVASTFLTGDVVENRVTAGALEDLGDRTPLDLGGNSSGVLALTLQSGRASDTQVASGTGAIAIGYATTASDGFSTALGPTATASGANSQSFGYGATASGTDSIGFGTSAVASGVNSIAVGTSASATDNSIVIGPVTNSFANLHKMAYISTCGKDIAAEPKVAYIGQENIIYSQEVDLTQAPATNIASFGTLPTSAEIYMYPIEFGIVITQPSNTVTVQPSIKITAYAPDGAQGVDVLSTVVNTISTVSNYERGRDVYTSFLTGTDALTTISLDLITSATATNLTGRFYMKFHALENTP